MNLEELTKKHGNQLKEKIEYIFNCFKQEFPNVCYSDRTNILGIGEPGKRLLCYFLDPDDGVVFVKFKSNKSISLLDNDISEIDLLIKETIKLFKENDFSLRKSKSEKDTTDIRDTKEINEIMAIYFAGVKKDIDVLIEQVILEHADVTLQYPLRLRTIETLNRQEVYKIGDLKGWDFDKVCRVFKYRVAKYLNFYNYLACLKERREVAKKEKNILNYKATKRYIDRALSDKETVEFLKEINYDENLFCNGTVGRVLCLMQKIKPVELSFSNSQADLIDACKSYNIMYKKFTLEYINLFATFIEQTILSDRDKEILLKFLGVNGNAFTLEPVAKENNISKERVRQIISIGIYKITKGINLYKEDGIIRHNQICEFLDKVNDYFIDGFMVHLQLNGYRQLFNAFYKTISVYAIPENLLEKIDLVCLHFKQLKRNKDITKHEQFKVKVDAYGDYLTDLSLLEKLKTIRKNIADRFGIKEKWICKDSQLVSLATVKPINKEQYLAIADISKNSWDFVGSFMVEVIVKHCQNNP